MASTSADAPVRSRWRCWTRPRSPDSTGHRCPVPVLVVGHGSPTMRQDVWLGW